MEHFFSRGPQNCNREAKAYTSSPALTLQTPVPSGNRPAPSAHALGPDSWSLCGPPRASLQVVTLELQRIMRPIPKSGLETPASFFCLRQHSLLILTSTNRNRSPERHQFPKPPRGPGPHLPTRTHMACRPVPSSSSCVSISMKLYRIISKGQPG